MTTFDRHLLSEWLHVLLLVMAALLGLLVVQICYTDLPAMLESNATLSEILRYIAVTIPSFASVALPLTLLISLLYALGKLHRANELTAMRAAGVGFGRIMAPIWLVGILMAFGVYYLNSSLVPWSVNRSDEIRAGIEFRKQSKTLTADKVGAVYDVAFQQPDSGRMWFFDRFSRATGHGYGVSVTQTERGAPYPARQLWAAEAWRSPVGWVFSDGREIAFDAETGEQRTSTPFGRREEPAFKEDPRLMLLTGQKAEDLSIFDLRRLVDYFERQNPPQAVPYAVRYHGMFADTLGPLIVIAIAIPFAVTGVRVNPVVGVTKSMGLFFAYYILTAASKSLALKGWIDPQVAAWLPNAAMGALGVLLFVRIR